MAETDTDAAAYVRLQDVSRTFGATLAVRNVTMDLAVSGRIHALIGENGAGKSTCLGMAAGRIAPTSGSVLVAGQLLPAGSPRAAKSLGVHAIYQELTVLPALTPQANVFLGQSLSTGGWLREREMRKRYEELCDEFGVPASASRSSGELSVADQQTLEILRALASDARCVLFDEPTASLAQAERDALFATMHRLRGDGLALTLVSHNLDEVLEHADAITVFRDGQVVESRPKTEWAKREMVAAMIGDDSRGAAIAMGSHRNRTASPALDRAAPPALTVRGLASPGIFEDVEFDLARGEILGIAGLVGSGRTSLLRALAGLDPRAKGEVRLLGERDGSGPARSVREARKRGISLLPEDRKGQGLLLSRNGTENITLGDWSGLSELGFVRTSRLRKAAAEAAGQCGFNVARLGELANTLSGGNQQKLMIARWLHSSFPVLLADEPTRGVDVGAKEEILRALEGIVAQGRSMIVVSSELEEVIGLSDRVLVVDSGRPLALLDAAEGSITPAQILKIIFGASELEAEPA